MINLTKTKQIENLKCEIAKLKLDNESLINELFNTIRIEDNLKYKYNNLLKNYNKLRKKHEYVMNIITNNNDI